MRIFSCSTCGHTVFFENFECTRCGQRLGYLPDRRVVSVLRPVEKKRFVADNGALYRECRNATEYAACNWMIPVDDPLSYCRACRLTTVMPDLDVPEALERWSKLEQAKRRLVYSIDAMGLPLESRRERPTNGLSFVFLAQGDLGREMVMTGHANGMVTINSNEADDPYREQVRKEMKEAYRTLLGHFRHEVGHYYWDRLIRDSAWLNAFRTLFGDEQLDYAKAAKRHYAEGPPRDWARTHVSAYATMHPWEDWAETWSHYLHIVDTLDTARAYSVAMQAKPEGGDPHQSLRLDEVDMRDFSSVIHAWITLTMTLNNLNRSMGLADLYPFVLSEAAVKKLHFVHDVIDRWRDAKPDEVRGLWPDRVSMPAAVHEKYDEV